MRRDLEERDETEKPIEQVEQVVNVETKDNKRQVWKEIRMMENLPTDAKLQSERCPKRRTVGCLVDSCTVGGGYL